MIDFDMSDETYDGVSYVNPQIMIQLGKILDSEGNPVPVQHVTTDDGYVYDIDFDQARIMLSVIRRLPTQVRREVIESIQYMEGMERFLDQIEPLFD
jgi:hypothetical protein